MKLPPKKKELDSDFVEPQPKVPPPPKKKEIDSDFVDPQPICTPFPENKLLEVENPKRITKPSTIKRSPYKDRLVSNKIEPSAEEENVAAWLFNLQGSEL
jgi:hypothetical protein